MFKPNNVFLHHDGKTVKIGDFGIAKIMQHTAQLMYTKTAIGVPAYQAVELLQIRATYTTSVDIWALGCILYELIHYDKLFVNDTKVGHPAVLMGMLIEKIRKHEHQPINESCPAKIREIILKCVDPEPTKRPTILELLDESIDLKMTLDQEANERDEDFG